MYKKQIFILIIFFIFSFSAYAQKVEKEKRIKVSKFPEKALQYLNQHYTDMGSAKYFRERTRDDVFYESKFICQGDFFSIKFHPDGSLYDIEKIISRDQIPDSAWQKISSMFNDDFKRWNIKKIQERSYKDLIEYEIVVEGKLAKQVKAFEYNFSEKGIFLRKEEIEGRFTDVMFY